MQVIEDDGIRYYLDEKGNRYRSVTGILSATKSQKDQNSIEMWRKRKGYEAADKVLNDACLRGTFTHTCAESFLTGQEIVLDYAPGISYWESLRPALKPIGEVTAMEVAISHPLGYAGRFDCFGEYNGIPNTIIDFKTSDRPKQRSYVNDYCLQLAAYAGGIKHTLGYDVNQGVIIIGIKNRTAQTFVLNKAELLFYWDLWVKRVEQYHAMQSKQSKSIDILEVA